jgi:hypothetical protein
LGKISSSRALYPALKLEWRSGGFTLYPSPPFRSGASLGRRAKKLAQYSGARLHVYTLDAFAVGFFADEILSTQLARFHAGSPER